MAVEFSQELNAFCPPVGIKVGWAKLMAVEFSQEINGFCPPYKLKTFCLLSKKNSLFPIPYSLFPVPLITHFPPGCIV